MENIKEINEKILQGHWHCPEHDMRMWVVNGRIILMETGETPFVDENLNVIYDPERNIVHLSDSITVSMIDGDEIFIKCKGEQIWFFQKQK